MYTKYELKVIAKAHKIFESKVLYSYAIENCGLAKDLCRTKLAPLEHEAFAVAFLTTKHKLISFDIMFQGTVNGAIVYTREIVKRALQHNACAVLLSHNHPSGDPQPSQSDKTITRELQDALKLIDVRVLDHIIVGVEGTYSFKDENIL